MTWPPEQCPQCLVANSVELTDDLRLCLACRHEWHPSVTDGPLTDSTTAPGPVGVPALVVVPEVAEAADIEAQVARARSMFVGATVVVHDLEVEGTIVEVHDAGTARVEFGSGYYVDVYPDDFSVVEPAPIDDRTAQIMAETYLAVAAQVVRAGAETIEERDGTRRLTLAPSGWLPFKGDEIPVVEHGASYAVAVIATLYGMSKQDLLSIADRLEASANRAEGTTNGQE